MIYPHFGAETGESSPDGRITVSARIQHDSNIMAIQLYNQVCFLYQKAKELKLESLNLQSEKMEML